MDKIINNNSLTMNCSYVFDTDEYMDKIKHKFKKSIITKSMINGQH
jgi:hypothetical protein